MLPSGKLGFFKVFSFCYRDFGCVGKLFMKLIFQSNSNSLCWSFLFERIEFMMIAPRSLSLN